MDDTIDDWFTKSQAAAFLKISEKTIERLATKGTVRRATRKRPGVRPLPVYNPDDLEQIRDSQIPRVEIVPQAEPQQRSRSFPALLTSYLHSCKTSYLPTSPCATSCFLPSKKRPASPGCPKRRSAG